MLFSLSLKQRFYTFFRTLDPMTFLPMNNYGYLRVILKQWVFDQWIIPHDSSAQEVLFTRYFGFTPNS